MADDNGAVGTPNGEPKLVEVTFDGKTFKVPEEMAGAAHELEVSIKGGYDRKLAEERATLQQEMATFQSNFEKDVTAYNKLLEQGITDFSVYDPLTTGGKGEMSQEALAEAQRRREEGVATPVTTRVLTPDVEKQYAERLAKLEERLEKLPTELDTKREVEGAVTALENEVLQYPLFDAALVLPAFKKELSTYHDTHGHAMPAKDITKMVKARHDKLVEKLPAGMATQIAHMPDTRGGEAPTRKTIPGEKPRIDDIGGWVKRASDLKVRIER